MARRSLSTWLTKTALAVLPASTKTPFGVVPFVLDCRSKAYPALAALACFLVWWGRAKQRPLVSAAKPRQGPRAAQALNSLIEQLTTRPMVGPLNSVVYGSSSSPWSGGSMASFPTSSRSPSCRIGTLFSGGRLSRSPVCSVSKAMTSAPNAA